MDSHIRDYLIHMLVPLRREFHRAVDVQTFLHDLSYAREVIDQAMQSRNPDLRERALYLERVMFGPRSGAAPNKLDPTTPAPAGDTPSAEPHPQKDSGEESEEVLRKRVLQKYTGGLR